MFDAAIDTIVMRPYVFTFFAAFLLACVPHLGWRKTLTFTLAGYLIAFTSEKLSITTGFPYGWYYYIDDTSHQELWVWGVPFFDSLSYVFLTYCSYTTALFILSPLAIQGVDLITLETRAIRHSWAALVLGAFLQTFLDIIIDPVALQGNRWFLGQIYGYYEAGLHFGVPISNYLGWLLTSFLLVAALQQIDRKRDGKAPRGVFAMPFRSLLGPVLYLSVLIFNWIVTLWIGEYLIALTGILIFTLPVVMVIVLAALRVNRYRAEELQEHLENYPWSPLNKS
ncbi:MAG: carotenoid biosynthesis protein [Nitrosomonas sp.]|uniref:carotenoid biosynthesis protein n=1 Tax=Nitrosomonas sp. TaxID=42353 RepID=UPI0025F01891|nr:carotenoid biosynthesis protein [Nitrosomonas sp.]UJP00797.1 MAG: carotenoid biosynthesis protein [Nitrosomonas sp.]UJP03990.1 MAG: carotenoid biosynthesis protein [Nitrosomonas sp.]